MGREIFLSYIQNKLETGEEHKNILLQKLGETL